MIVSSYNYSEGYMNYTKYFDGSWGKYITKSYAEGTNAIAVANYDAVNVLDRDTGDTLAVFKTSTEIINLYAFINSDTYLVILKDGTVNYLSMVNRNSIELYDELRTKQFENNVLIHIDEFNMIVNTDNNMFEIVK